jgi:FixJ family two-component response regulator
MAVIFLSGSHDPTVVARAGGVGPVRFLHKPFRPAEMLSAIEAAVEGMRVGRRRPAGGARADLLCR